MAFEPRWFRVAFLARDWISSAWCLYQSFHWKPGRIGSSKLLSFIILRNDSSTQRLDQKRLSFWTSFGDTSSSVAAWRIMWNASLVFRVLRVFDRKRLPVLARNCPSSPAINPSYNFWDNLSTLSFCCAANAAMPPKTENAYEPGMATTNLMKTTSTSYIVANPPKNYPTLLEKT